MANDVFQTASYQSVNKSNWKINSKIAFYVKKIKLEKSVNEKISNLIDLDTWCWFRCVGSDAERYLQGQITQDIRLLETQHFIHAALLSNKGRVVSDLKVFKSGKSYLLAGHRERRSEILERLLRYLIADEVEIFSLEQQKAIFYADSMLMQIIDGHKDVLNYELLGVTGKIILMDSDSLIKYKPVSIKALEFLRVRSFTPEWGHEITEKTLLQELSDDKKWFSTTKGCYVGQEVVARIHSIGQVNKRLFLFSTGAGAALREREKLLADGLEAGFLTSVASDTQSGACFALGYLKRPFWEQSSFVTASGGFVNVVGKSEVNARP